MWALDNESGLAAGRTWARDKHGVHVWIVVVKATYDVDERGTLKLVEEQPEPLLAPEYLADPATSSLRADADLLGPRPTTDVVFVGDAHAPGGRPVRSLPVSLRVGPVHKQLNVFGTRVFHAGAAGLALSAPAEFVSRELTYEWAYGGADLAHPDPRRRVMDARNPVGRGVAGDAGQLIGQASHSIEYLAGHFASSGPAGFAPIASHWAPRLGLAGTYDERWSQTRKPLLPLDYDERHALCSPADQRPPTFLLGGELVELVHLVPWGVWRFALPRLGVSFVTAFGRRRVEHAGQLASVSIDGRARRLSVCWQGSLQVAAPDCDYLDRTTVSVKA